MKKFNRVAALFLVVVMGLSIMACGEKETDVTGEKTTETVAGEVTSNSEQEAAKVHVDILRSSLSESSALNEEKIKEVETAINAYIADKINVEISLTEAGADEYSEKSMGALTDEKTDLIWMDLSEEGNSLKNIVSEETPAIKDLTELLAGTALYSSADEVMWKASLYGGKNYFVPVFNGNGKGYAFLFRKDIADTYEWNLTNLKNPAAIEPMLADAKEEGLEYPFLTQKTATFSMWYIDSFDFFTDDTASSWIAVDRSTNEVIDTVTTPEYFEFCSLMSFWADEGYISDEDIMKKTSSKVLKSQDWAISWWNGSVGEMEAQKICDQSIVTVAGTGRYLDIDSMTGSAYVISGISTDAEAKACIDFLGLLYTDEKLADLYTYGIEGSDFEYDADGYVVRLSEDYNHSMKDSAAATAVTAEASAPYDKAEVAELNAKAVISKSNGFYFDVTPVASEYEACKKAFEQYGYALENGGYAASDVESAIAQYQSALDAAGYQKVLEEFTNQYNAWK